MEAAYLSAISALAGSADSVRASRRGCRFALRQGPSHHAHQMARRQDLFRDFIVAASRAYGNALLSNEPKIQELVELYAMISRMRVLCSPQMVACADEVMRLIIETYFGPNRSIRELHELIKSDSAIDPLRKFSEMARDELAEFAALLR